VLTLSETTRLPEQAPSISAIASDAAVAKRTILEPQVLTGNDPDIYPLVPVANPELIRAMVDD
jgi:hypothetical protein